MAKLVDVLIHTPYKGWSWSNKYKSPQGRIHPIENQYNKQRYWSLLYKLKRDGLIYQVQTAQRMGLAITKKGEQKLMRLMKNKVSPLPTAQYQKEKSTVFTIITFDVPEKKRRKRDWLRWVLKNLGLTMIQKSVWIGKVKVPKEFIDDLARLQLLKCVEVFQITKTGTLKHIA